MSKYDNDKTLNIKLACNCNGVYGDLGKFEKRCRNKSIDDYNPDTMVKRYYDYVKSESR